MTDLAPCATPVRSRTTTWMWLAVSGGAFGALTSTLNHVGGGSVVEYASKIVDSEWAWILVAYLASLTGRCWSSFRHTQVVMSAAVIAYYLSDLLFGTYGRGSDIAWSDVGSDVLAYLLMAVVVSAGMAVLNLGIRSGRLWGVVAAAVPTGYIAVRALSLYRAPGMLPTVEPKLVQVSLWVGVLAAAATVWVLIVRGRRWARARATRA